MPHKNTIPLKTRQPRTIPYVAACAAGLVQYAKTDPKFDTLFREMIYDTLPPEMFSDDELFRLHNTSTYSPLLLPKDPESAQRRAIWLMNTGERFRGADTAARILLAYAKQRPMEVPQQITIGIKIGIIPPLTFGQTKKRNFMPIIIREDAAKDLNQLDMSRRGIQACMAVISQALEAAGGDARDLEPDIYDWLFGEKGIRYFTVGRSELDRIQGDLKQINVPHAPIRKNGTVVGLAISPTIDADQHGTDWGLEALEE